MIRRRAAAAGIIAPIGNHTFRATGITAYLGNGGALEHAQSMAAHESPRTTKLYDRTQGTAHAGRGGEDPAISEHSWDAQHNILYVALIFAMKVRP